MTDSIRKLAYVIYRDFFQHQKFKISLKTFDNFNKFPQTIDCECTLEPPREYPQSVFWNKNKKNRYTSVNMRGYTFHGHVFVTDSVSQLF